MGNKPSSSRFCFFDGEQWRCYHKSSSGDTSECTVTRGDDCCDKLSEVSGITVGGVQELMKEMEQSDDYKDNYAINWMTGYHMKDGFLGKREARCVKKGVKWHCIDSHLLGAKCEYDPRNKGWESKWWCPMTKDFPYFVVFPPMRGHTRQMAAIMKEAAVIEANEKKIRQHQKESKEDN